MQSPRAAEHAPAPSVGQALPRELYLNGLPRHWHAVPDTVMDGADFESLSVRGASLRGADHRVNGAPRQDAMGIYPVTADGIEAILGCVADGRDDEPLSHLGAEQACLIVRDEVRARLASLMPHMGMPAAENYKELGAVCKDLLRSLAERLAGRAALVKAEPRALSVTLAAVVVNTDPDYEGTRRWLAFQVGDSSVIHMTANGPKPLFSRPLALKLGDQVPTLPTSIESGYLRRGTLGHAGALVVCTGSLAKLISFPDVGSRVNAWWGGTTVVPDLPEFAQQVELSSGRRAGLPETREGERIAASRGDLTAICFWGR